MFRRRSSDSSGLLEQDQEAPSPEAATPVSRPRPGFTAPKGVPTPKRSEAQSSRRQPYLPPANRKAATRQARERERSDRARQTDAYQRGEEWAMPRKDKGPVRALARDVVDARRGIAEYYMVLAVVTVALLFLFPASLKGVADALVFVVLAVVVGEGWLVGQKVKRLARERYPDHSTRGVTAYAVMRGIAMRRMRMPKPRVSRGDKV